MQNDSLIRARGESFVMLPPGDDRQLIQMLAGNAGVYGVYGFMFVFLDTRHSERSCLKKLGKAELSGSDQLPPPCHQLEGIDGDRDRDLLYFRSCRS